MPFNDIELIYGAVGLCLPGVGIVRYTEMGRHLAMYLKEKLPMGEEYEDSHLAQALTLVASKPHPNGYEMLQTLFEECISSFQLDDMEMTWPTYDDFDHPFLYAEAMSNQVLMARKRGQIILAKNEARTFLKNIMEHANKDHYKWAAMLLKDQLDSLDVDETLPPKFDLKRMATYIAGAKTQPSDVRGIGNKQHGNVTKSAQMMQQAPPPTSSPPTRQLPHMESRYTDNLSPNSHIQGYSISRFQANEQYRDKGPLKAQRRPRPNLAHARHFGRPQQPFDPTAYCDACGRWGHKAITCDMLAMAVWLKDFMNRGGSKEQIEQVQQYWVERNSKEQALRPEDKKDDRSPLRVLET